MPQAIKAITLSLPYRLGSVNCYLLITGTGFVLVDTGGSNQRTELVNELANASCRPGDLKLIIVTHGDFDHIGNCAYLREKFGAKIAMHRDDLGMAERGDMFWNRKKPNILIRTIFPIFYRLGGTDKFEPDVLLDENTDFTEYGFDARVISIPGHSKGSIGILTEDGDLFCGDIFENTDGPVLNSIMDDAWAANASLEKLKRLPINLVFPGHGHPFPMQQLIEDH